MIEELATRIARAQTKKPVAFILAFILITLLFVPGIFRLVDHIEPSLEKVLPQNVPEVKAMNDMRNQFGADLMYVILYPEPPLYDVREPAFLTYQDSVVQKLRTQDHVLSATSLSDVIKNRQNNVLPTRLNENKAVLSQAPERWQYTNPEYSISVIRLQTSTGNDASTINTLVNNINDDLSSLEASNPGSRYELTGFNAIDKATFEVIMSDFARITLVSMTLIGIVVFLTFRNLKKALQPLTVMMVALLWTMGLVGYLGLTITVVTMVAAAMIMGLGIDFGIHVVHTYNEKRTKHNPKKSLEETLKELLRAMTGASVTTMAGFLALLFGVLPAMKTLAIVLATGIFFTLIGAVLLLPAIVYKGDSL